jgi:hypothetical protein
MKTATKEVLAKGINFTCAKKYIETNYGSETWEQIMSRLTPEAAAVWNSSLLSGSEYPFSAFKEMISSTIAVLRTTNNDEIAAIYEYIADQSLNSMYKIFFKFANPSYVIKNYPLLWTRFFNAGVVDVPAAEKGRGVVRFLLPDIFDDWLAPACLGYSRKAVEMGGGKDLRMERTAYLKKNDGLFESVYELRWTE